MAISELCPETGEVRQARLCQEIEGSIIAERYDSDDLFSGDTLGQKALRVWDNIVGVGTADRNKDLEEDIQWITSAAETHEKLAMVGIKSATVHFAQLWHK